MLRGILSGVMAMRGQVLKQEVIANNLANVNTNGYKKDEATFHSFRDMLLYRLEPLTQQVCGDWSVGYVMHEIRTVDDVGPAEVTGDPLNVFLPQGVYLAVEAENGTRYTRCGELTVSPEGYLSVNGHPVLGENGLIRLGNKNDARITEDGRVWEGERQVGTLALWSLNKNDISKEGGSLVTCGDVRRAENVRLMVGAVEKSSVDPVKEMVELVSAMRSFEAAQRAIRAHDETLDHAVNRVGKVS